MESGNILETRGLSKSYPGVQALDSVDFDLRFGEVQALVGQNGAGKSTLIEIIAGSLRPDSGTILIGGQEFAALDPSRSIEMGVQTVHQDNQLVDELSVAENIYLYNLPQAGPGFVSQGRSIAASEELLQRLGIEVGPGQEDEGSHLHRAQAREHREGLLAQRPHPHPGRAHRVPGRKGQDGPLQHHPRPHEAGSLGDLHLAQPGRDLRRLRPRDRHGGRPQGGHEPR